MSIFDISLIIILGGFIVNGLFKGLIRLLGHVVGIIIGAYAASHFYLVIYEWSKNIFNGHENVGKVVAFILLFIIVTRLTDWLFVLIEKIFKLVAIIPGSKYINNILGAALGFVEGALFLGLILFVVIRYTPVGATFAAQLAESVMVPFLLKIVRIILPILPDALKALKTIV
ncbi:MAG: CvpA family protein [Patescibacteria group bacterium]|jgi:membrane protein required for colicin V production